MLLVLLLLVVGRQLVLLADKLSMLGDCRCKAGQLVVLLHLGGADWLGDGHNARVGPQEGRGAGHLLLMLAAVVQRLLLVVLVLVVLMLVISITMQLLWLLVWVHWAHLWLSRVIQGWRRLDVGWVDMLMLLTRLRALSVRILRSIQPWLTA